MRAELIQASDGDIGAFLLWEDDQGFTVSLRQKTGIAHVPVDVMQGNIYVDKTAHSSPEAFYQYYAEHPVEHSGRVYGLLLAPVAAY